jgi:hypothetical protein
MLLSRSACAVTSGRRPSDERRREGGHEPKRWRARPQGRPRVDKGRRAGRAAHLRLHDALHVGGPAVLAGHQHAGAGHQPVADHHLRSRASGAGGQGLSGQPGRWEQLATPEPPRLPQPCQAAVCSNPSPAAAAQPPSSPAAAAAAAAAGPTFSTLSPRISFMALHSGSNLARSSSCGQAGGRAGRAQPQPPLLLASNRACLVAAPGCCFPQPTHPGVHHSNPQQSPSSAPAAPPAEPPAGSARTFFFFSSSSSSSLRPSRVQETSFLPSYSLSCCTMYLRAGGQAGRAPGPRQPPPAQRRGAHPPGTQQAGAAGGRAQHGRVTARSRTHRWRRPAAAPRSPSSSGAPRRASAPRRGGSRRSRSRCRTGPPSCGSRSPSGWWPRRLSKAGGRAATRRQAAGALEPLPRVSALAGSMHAAAQGRRRAGMSSERRAGGRLQAGPVPRTALGGVEAQQLGQLGPVLRVLVHAQLEVLGEGLVELGVVVLQQAGAVGSWVCMVVHSGGAGRTSGQGVSQTAAAPRHSARPAALAAPRWAP